MGAGLDIRVIFEPTRTCHRQMESQDIAFVKVNPRQARRFAEATGTQARTDRVDAMLLARKGAVLDLRPSAVRSQTLHELRELHVARAGLIKGNRPIGTACRNGR